MSADLILQVLFRNRTGLFSAIAGFLLKFHIHRTCLIPEPNMMLTWPLDYKLYITKKTRPCQKHWLSYHNWSKSWNDNLFSLFSEFSTHWWPGSGRIWYSSHYIKFKGAVKSYFTHCFFAFVISFNSCLCRSAFPSISFGKLVFRLSVLSVFLVLNQMFWIKI